MYFIKFNTLLGAKKVGPYPEEEAKMKLAEYQKNWVGYYIFELEKKCDAQ